MIRACILALVPLAPVLTAAAPGLYTPPPGSAERSAIVKLLHHGDDRPAARFTFRTFTVFRVGPKALAYVQGSGQVGEFEALLEQKGTHRWRKVWGVSDGGSDSCEAGARHYAWAVRRIQSYGLPPDTLIPGITAQARALARQAKTEPDLQCVGDLDGGPDGPDDPDA
ncbi:hypothetical protein [Sphingomonas sp.]|uniref:hypothetical protein n=1 Tax=Sphingomonas sp. TaxID=28214 RepID=UPI0028B00693|nr:hypothetical protein [Sphingomonas sp.]